jgi:tetratricopeptide (TPR) repeat protein
MTSIPRSPDTADVPAVGRRHPRQLQARPPLGRSTLILGAVASILLAAPLQSQSSGDDARLTRLYDAAEYGRIRAEMSSRLKSRSNDPLALYWLGRVAVSQEQHGEAVKYLEQSIAADSKRADAYAWLGTALGMSARNTGRVRQMSLAKRSRDSYEKALSIDPRNVAAREGLAQYYSIVPSVIGGSTSKARQQAAELAKVNRMRGHISTGLIAERAKDHASAERELKAAIAAAPDSAIAHLALGHYYARVKRWGDATEAYERLLARDPGSKPALYHIGRIGALSGERLERAHDALTRWLTRPPDDPVSIRKARTRLAEIEARRGRLAATP